MILKIVKFLLLLICATIVAYGVVQRSNTIKESLHEPLKIELPVSQNTDILYRREVFKDESTKKFELLQGAAQKSREETIRVARENIKIIDKVYNSPKPKRMDEYRLWVLLKRLDGVHASKLSDYDQLIRMYDILQVTIPRPPVPTFGCKNILKLLENGGDCNDWVTTYYAILQYYAFGSISMSFGRAYDLNIETNKFEYMAPHVWLDIKLNKFEYSLDPTWYHRYIELPKRNGEHENVEDKFIIRRPK